MHEVQGFGLCKFKLDKDVTTPITFSFDQVNARFVDETMQGAYEYPPIKFMLTQVVKGQSGNFQAFTFGEREADCHCSSPFPEGLPAGEYILMYQGEFSPEHPEHKIVLSIYAEKNVKIDLKPIDERTYPHEYFTELDYAHYEQFQQYGSEADPPSFDSIAAVFNRG